MKKLKICYLAKWNIIHTQRWLRYFVEKGHIVHLISDDPCECKELKGVTLHNLSFRGAYKIKKLSHALYTFICKMRLSRLLKSIKPDILHSHFAADDGWLGAMSGFHPFVLTVWGSDIYLLPKESKYMEQRVKFALKTADLITSDSEDLMKATIALGASSDSNHIVQWGVNFQQFNPQVDGANIRKKLDLKDSPVVLSARHFNRLYNIDTIIRTIPIVLREIPGAKFILKNYCGNEEKKMIGLVGQLGVEKAVRFIGKVDYEEVAGYYRASDIFISVPSSDSTSISMLEAMACGVPVIVSDLPAMREWIKDGENGYVVPPRDIASLANAIIRLLKDENTRKLFAQRNIEIVREKADYYKQMRRMEEIYLNLTER